MSIYSDYKSTSSTLPKRLLGKHSLFIGMALSLCSLTTACQSQVTTKSVSVAIKENLDNADKYDDIDYTINNVTFTTGKSYNERKGAYTDPAVEVCMTIKNNKDDMIAPLFVDAMNRIRLFQRGVECDSISTLLINGELFDYDLSEKFVLPGRSFNACRGFKLNYKTGLLETTFFYKKIGDADSINHLIAESTID